MTSVGCGRGTIVARWSVSASTRGDVEHVLGFEPEVELFDDRLREQLDERRRVGERGDRDAADEARREPRHRLEIGTDELGDLRALHLHDDLLAGAQPGPVHLRDRGGRDRRAIEATKTSSSERPSSSSTTRRTSSKSSAGTRSRSCLNSCDELFGKEPFATGDDLAELDVGRAEPPEGDAQPAGDGLLAGGAAAAAFEHEPRAEGVPDLPDDASQPAERRQVARFEPLRHLPLCLGAQSFDVAPPGHGRGIDDPRAVVGESTDCQIRGRHRRSVGRRRREPARHPAPGGTPGATQHSI